MNKAVIVGAQGVIGRYIADHLVKEGGWQVTGLSRRKPAEASGIAHVSVDLLDRADAETKLAGLSDVSHIFYCVFSRRDRPGLSTTHPISPCS